MSRFLISPQKTKNAHFIEKQPFFRIKTLKNPTLKTVSVF